MSPSHHPPYSTLPPLLHDPSCLQAPPHPHPSPTLHLFSTPHWNLTNVKPNKTYPRILSLQAFNPAIPLRLSFPSFGSKSPYPANLKIATRDSQDGSHRP